MYEPLALELNYIYLCGNQSSIQQWIHTLEQKGQYFSAFESMEEDDPSSPDQYFIQLSAEHQQLTLHFSRVGRLYQLKNKSLSVTQESLVVLLLQLFQCMSGDAIAKLTTKDEQLVSIIKRGQIIKTTRVEGSKQTVIFNQGVKQNERVLPCFSPSLLKGELQQELTWVRRRIDEELDRLQLSIEGKKEDEIHSCKQRLQEWHGKLVELQNKIRFAL